MGSTTFESSSSSFAIHIPFKDFAEEQHLVEVRKDPLLGNTSVCNPFLKDKAKVFCVFKIVNRQNLYPNYRNDDYFLQKLLHSELVITPPEELASRLRDCF